MTSSLFVIQFSKRIFWDVSVKKKGKVKYYSALEVANLCGVVNQTAINWIKKHYLKAFTTPGGQYRISGEDLAQFLQQRGMKIPYDLKEYSIGSSFSVLLVEDDEKFASQFLDELKYEYPHFVLNRAVDSFDAGGKLAVEKSDLILINDDMAGLDACNICKSIRSNNSGEKKSIIIFTRIVDNIKKESLLKSGADVYLKKPFDIGQISIYLE